MQVCGGTIQTRNEECTFRLSHYSSTRNNSGMRVEEWIIHRRQGMIRGMQVCGGTIQTRNDSGMIHCWIIACRRRMIQPKSAFLDWIIILRHTHSHLARLSTTSVSKNEVKCVEERSEGLMKASQSRNDSVWWFSREVNRSVIESRNESQSRKWFLIWGERVGNQAPEHFWVFFWKTPGDLEQETPCVNTPM